MIGTAFPEVLARARRGDHPALELLYRDTAPLVIGYLRGTGANDAEDLASEVYLAVVRSIADFEGDERHFRSWLLTIAHRRMIDQLRARGRRPEEPVDGEVLMQLAGAVRSGENAALDRLAAQGVLSAMEELTVDQRSVLMLRVLADLPLDEVAQLLDKPLTAVKALQRRANASLLRTLAPEASEVAG